MNNLNRETVNNRFSVRLANGKEQTFESAAAMAQWMQKQREFDYIRRPAKRKSARRTANPRRPRGGRCDNLPPLARFAKSRG